MKKLLILLIFSAFLFSCEEKSFTEKLEDRFEEAKESISGEESELEKFAEDMIDELDDLKHAGNDILKDEYEKLDEKANELNEYIKNGEAKRYLLNRYIKAFEILRKKMKANEMETQKIDATIEKLKNARDSS